ncbi:MAG: hypothetical protein AAFO85_19565, partial [Cyanobacteria bacterium J06598_4]
MHSEALAFVWQNFNENSSASVMLATIEEIKSSSIPPVDRPTQIMNISAIVIFGLVSIYLLKKLMGD